MNLRVRSSRHIAGGEPDARDADFPSSPRATARSASGSRMTIEYVGKGTPMVTGLFGVSSVKVAVTVASVGP